MSRGIPPATLPETLSSHAASRGDDIAYRFLIDGEREDRALTYAQLDLAARAVAARLQRHTRPGERALILASDNSPAFVIAFLGCQYAGVIAVPVARPAALGSRRRVQTLRAIAHDSEVRVVLSDDAETFRTRIATVAAELAERPWIDVDRVPSSAAQDREAVLVHPDDVAFLQYTSGSTAQPKGVMITHRSLLANVRYLCERMGTNSDDVIVCWMPLFHDSGLIVNALQSLHLGATTVLMPPLAFAQRPERWLRAIEHYRGTMAGAPNFAYDLCVRRIDRQLRSSLDLRSWRLAFNAAEPVRAASLERFADAFALAGFDRRALYPCYGLAEVTVFGIGPDRGIGPGVLAVDPEALRAGRLVPGGSQHLVSCGRATPPRHLLIVDPESGNRLEDDTVGEIWLSGPDVAAGYWGHEAQTLETFGARTADGQGPFLRTGDLGAQHEGDVFVVGRLKDLVIIDGRNHYPQDIEATVAAAHPWVRPDCVAAFAIEEDDQEQLMIIAELLRPADDPIQIPLHQMAEQARQAIRVAVSAEHGLAAARIALVAPGSVPKTSSGKVQRRACRAGYQAGALRPVAAGGVPQPQGAL